MINYIKNIIFEYFRGTREFWSCIYFDTMCELELNPRKDEDYLSYYKRTGWESLKFLKTINHDIIRNLNRQEYTFLYTRYYGNVSSMYIMEAIGHFFFIIG